MVLPPPWLAERPTDRDGWARWYCAGLSLFVVQAIVVLGFYALRGFDTPSGQLPLGLQLDPRHGVLHLAIGLVGAVAAFVRPSAATAVVRAFAVLYLGLAVLGTFTTVDFGMELALPENTLHFVLGGLALILGFWPGLDDGRPPGRG
jgi:hypothetical protein